MKILNLGNRIVNCYLLIHENHKILIDTGYPENFDNFLKQIRKHNINFADIDYLLLTHAHDDHVGFVNKIMTKCKNITVVVSEKSKDRFILGHNAFIGGSSSFLAHIVVNILNFAGKGKHEFPEIVLPVSTIYFDGKLQPFKERNIPIEIVALPGHTKDSLGFIYNNNILFCGDAAMSGIPSLHKQIIWIENLEKYKDSWHKMMNMNLKYIYPGHGPRFSAKELVKNEHYLKNIKLY